LACELPAAGSDDVEHDDINHDGPEHDSLS
jgi:hypothetical protein